MPSPVVDAEMSSFDVVGREKDLSLSRKEVFWDLRE